MPAKRAAQIDRYANRAFALVQMSAANTITFEQVRFSVGTFQGYAIRLNRIEAYPSNASLRELVAATDDLQVGLTVRDDLTDLTPTNQSVLAHSRIVGVGANTEPIQIPLVMDFSRLPEGALLIQPNPLYLAMNTGGAAAASICRFILYYQFISLSDREALELLQTIIPGNV